MLKQSDQSRLKSQTNWHRNERTLSISTKKRKKLRRRKKKKLILISIHYLEKKWPRLRVITISTPIIFILSILELKGTPLFIIKGNLVTKQTCRDKIAALLSSRNLRTYHHIFKWLKLLALFSEFKIIIFWSHIIDTEA